MANEARKFDTAAPPQKLGNSPVYDPVTRAARNYTDVMRDAEPDPDRLDRAAKEVKDAASGGRTEYVTRNKLKSKASRRYSRSPSYGK